MITGNVSAAGTKQAADVIFEFYLTINYKIVR